MSVNPYVFIRFSSSFVVKVKTLYTILPVQFQPNSNNHQKMGLMESFSIITKL